MTRTQSALIVSLLGVALLAGGILIGDEPAATGARLGSSGSGLEQPQPTAPSTSAPAARNSLERLPSVLRTGFDAPASPGLDNRTVLAHDEPEPTGSSPVRQAAPVHWLDGPLARPPTTRSGSGQVQRQPALVPYSERGQESYRQRLPGGNDDELVTLHLNEVSVRQALETLSRSHGLNILVAPGVAGQVTANIESMEVGRALDAILKLSGHVAQREEGLIYVYAESELPRSDFRVKVFPLDFVSAIDVLPVAANLLSTNGLASASSVDPTDNTKAREAIIVTDRPEVLLRVTDFLEQVDVPPLQVMIEAHVLQIDLGDDLKHGVNYKQAMNAVGTGFEFEVADFADPMASPAVFARIAGPKVDGLLHFLKSTTHAKTLASPRVMVINGQKARIQVGEQIPYKVVTVTETAAVEEVKFLEVGVVLEVTPRISRDGRVMMRVKPEVSDGKFDAAIGLPGEETREVESDVLLEDGQGVVIGGLIHEKDTERQTKVPWLGDLHLVGRLFQKREVIKERTEIVITIVPRICVSGTGTSHRDAIDAERSQTPLFTGPLHRLQRPWEPNFPDAIHNPRRLWGNHLGMCRECGRDACVCESWNGVYEVQSPTHAAPAPEPTPRGDDSRGAELPGFELPLPPATAVPLESGAATSHPGPPRVIVDPLSVNGSVNTLQPATLLRGWPATGVATASAESAFVGETAETERYARFPAGPPPLGSQPASVRANVDTRRAEPFRPPPLRVRSPAAPLRSEAAHAPETTARGSNVLYLPLPRPQQ